MSPREEARNRTISAKNRALAAPLERAGLFFLVRPAGRTYLEVKVLYSPGKGKS